MKTKEEIEKRILALVVQMKSSDKAKHDRIRGAIAGLEWVIEELDDLDTVIEESRR